MKETTRQLESLDNSFEQWKSDNHETMDIRDLEVIVELFCTLGRVIARVYRRWKHDVENADERFVEDHYQSHIRVIGFWLEVSSNLRNAMEKYSQYEIGHRDFEAMVIEIESLDLDRPAIPAYMTSTIDFSLTREFAEGVSQLMQKPLPKKCPEGQAMEYADPSILD